MMQKNALHHARRNSAAVQGFLPSDREPFSSTPPQIPDTRSTATAKVSHCLPTSIAVPQRFPAAVSRFLALHHRSPSAAVSARWGHFSHTTGTSPSGSSASDTSPCWGKRTFWGPTMTGLWCARPSSTFPARAFFVQFGRTLHCRVRMRPCNALEQQARRSKSIYCRL